MWIIHNKKYNLEEFKKIHPMGENVIELFKNTDCTVQFEVFHSMSNKDVHKMLEKYYIEDCDVKNKEFDFTSYNELVKEVKNKVFSSNKNYKATYSSIIKMILLILVYSSLFIYNFYCKQYLINFAVLGVIGSMLKFIGTTHDASHYALSTNYKINELICKISCSMFFFNFKKWIYHHVNHHLYTNISNMDPDLYHIEELYNKDTNIPNSPVHKYQYITIFLFDFLFPTKLVGQIYAYVTNYKTLFKVLNVRNITHDNLSKIISGFMLWHIIYLVYTYKLYGLYCILIYFFSAGFYYALCINFNHDTNDVIKMDDNLDWAKQQIVSSNNFNVFFKFINFIMGHMNYQIEHHLFPTVSNVHYPAISTIVKDFCKKNDIKYNYYNINSLIKHTYNYYKR